MYENLWLGSTTMRAGEDVFAATLLCSRQGWPWIPKDGRDGEIAKQSQEVGQRVCLMIFDCLKLFSIIKA